MGDGEGGGARGGRWKVVISEEVMGRGSAVWRVVLVGRGRAKDRKGGARMIVSMTMVATFPRRYCTSAYGDSDGGGEGGEEGGGEEGRGEGSGEEEGGGEVGRREATWSWWTTSVTVSMVSMTMVSMAMVSTVTMMPRPAGR